VIDVPIGIMDGMPRAADQAARRMLRHRACCVFSAPYRAMLGARSFEEASAARKRLDGKGCSRQTFGIIGKIAEVDALMSPENQARVREGHPEVTFAVMCDKPIDERKKTGAGRAARLAALRPSFPDLDDRLVARTPSGVGRDDVLDAYAMLWTARRLVAGTALCLPEPDQRDSRGLRAEIVA
jgi:predicted RNase H-like nuclease